MCVLYVYVWLISVYCVVEEYVLSLGMIWSYLPERSKVN